MTIPRHHSEPTNHLTPHDHPDITTLALAFRQARLRLIPDAYEWGALTQDDVDRARDVHETLRATRPHLKVLKGGKP